MTSDDEPRTATDEPYLTDAEHETMERLGLAFQGLQYIIRQSGDRRGYAGDLAEAVHHIHALQNMVMAQAAARAYPGRYRLLGHRFGRSAGPPL